MIILKVTVRSSKIIQAFMKENNLWKNNLDCPNIFEIAYLLVYPGDNTRGQNKAARNCLLKKFVCNCKISNADNYRPSVILGVWKKGERFWPVWKLEESWI